MLIWIMLKRTAFVRTLFAVGDDDAATFSAGIDVVKVRIFAYALGGLFAGFGAIALTALLRSADATQGGQYTLLAIAAVALGGTTLNGGRGSLRGAIFGALAIFLLQSVLTALDGPSTWLRSAYGVALLAGVIIGARALQRNRS
jgi:ribose transport system permease protein